MTLMGHVDFLVFFSKSDNPFWISLCGFNLIYQVLYLVDHLLSNSMLILNGQLTNMNLRALFRSLLDTAFRNFYHVLFRGIL